MVDRRTNRAKLKARQPGYAKAVRNDGRNLRRFVP